MHTGDIHFFGDDADKFRVTLGRDDHSSTIRIGDPAQFEVVIFVPCGLGRAFDYLMEFRDAIDEVLSDPMFVDQPEQARIRALKAATLRCSDCGHTMTREEWEEHCGKEARFDEECVGIDEDGICPECEIGVMEEAA